MNLPRPKPQLLVWVLLAFSPPLEALGQARSPSEKPSAEVHGDASTKFPETIDAPPEGHLKPGSKIRVSFRQPELGPLTGVLRRIEAGHVEVESEAVVQSVGKGSVLRLEVRTIRTRSGRGVLIGLLAWGALAYASTATAGGNDGSGVLTVRSFATLGTLMLGGSWIGSKFRRDTWEVTPWPEA